MSIKKNRSGLPDTNTFDFLLLTCSVLTQPDIYRWMEHYTSPRFFRSHHSPESAATYTASAHQLSQSGTVVICSSS